MDGWESNDEDAYVRRRECQNPACRDAMGRLRQFHTEERVKPLQDIEPA